MNGYAYTRVSGLGQADKDGPVRQMCEIRAFADGNGIHLAGDFSDVITGEAESVDRPGWAAMLASILHLNREAAKLGVLGNAIRVDCIIAENMTRLGRDMITIENLLRNCRTHGIKVYIPSFGLKDVCTMEGSPDQIFCRQVLSAVAQLEKNMIIFRLRAPRDRARAAGKRCEGRKPYGTHPKELEILEAAAHIHNVCGKSYAETARLLNLAKLKTRTGKKWNRHLVMNILSRRPGQEQGPIEREEEDYENVEPPIE